MKKILLLVGFMMLGMLVTSIGIADETYPPEVKNVTALTESFGLGQKVTAVVIEYNQTIKNSKLTTDSYSVSDRTVIRVYANDKLEKVAENKKGKDGKYVVVEVKPLDGNTELVGQTGGFGSLAVVKPADVTVTQLKDITTTNGKKIVSTNMALKNNNQKDLVVEDFKQLEYKDPKTGVTLKYNLYIPKNYDKNKKYPMVMFIHDAGPLSENTKTTLYQGNGATIWATPSEQAKHESFVLAPQYSVQVVNDNAEYTQDLPATVNLIQDYLVKEYNIDTNRLYTTGQSMGGMMSIVMNYEHPNLFAASYFVASQWDATKVGPMAKNKIWTVISTGDAKAFPTWQKMLPVLQENGAKIVTNGEDYWDGKNTVEEFNKLVEGILAKDPTANVHFTPIEKGTLPALQEGNPGSEHMATWKTAYYIEAIRDWLFKQSK